MAGRLFSCKYCRLLLLLTALALAGMIAASATGWNPLPGVQDWWHRFTALSQPPPRWTHSLGGPPEQAAIMRGGEVMVASRGFVEVYDPATDRLLWSLPVHWALAAEDVVVYAERDTDSRGKKGTADRGGYAVVDSRSGVSRWQNEAATAVWAYQDRILDLTCPEVGACTLRSRRHGDGGTEWAAALPASAREVTGPNPDLLDTRDPAGWFALAAAGSPGPAPPVLAIPIAGKIYAVTEGFVREVAAPGREIRTAFAGGRILLSHANPADTCRFTVEALDVRTGQVAWRQEGFDLNTTSGAGCEQRRDPLGAGGHLAAVRGDNRPILVTAADGAVVWQGESGERVLATDGRLAMIAGADRRTVRVVDLIDANRLVWTGDAGLRPEGAVTDSFIVVRNNEKKRLTVLDRSASRVLADVQTDEEVVGYGPTGLLIARGRTIGLVAVAPSRIAASGAAGGAPGRAQRYQRLDEGPATWSLYLITSKCSVCSSTPDQVAATASWPELA